MPFLKAAPTSLCDESDPCTRDRCVRCWAELMLTPSDWRLIGFYNRVSSQFVNQTPMGGKDGSVVLTPRLEGFEAALRIYTYPRDEWPWLIDGASMLHRLVHGQDKVSSRMLRDTPLEGFL